MNTYKGVSLPIELMNQIDEAIDKQGYVSKTDFIRTAIRNELTKIKVLQEEKHESL